MEMLKWMRDVLFSQQEILQHVPVHGRYSGLPVCFGRVFQEDTESVNVIPRC